MDNEDRIRRWRAARDNPAKTPETPGASARGADALSPDGDVPIDRAAAPGLPDEAALEEARIAIVERRNARWRDIVRRAMLFVAIPLLTVLMYIGLIATPLHQGEAVFAVQTSDSSTPAPSAGLLGLGAGTTTLSDAFRAREFILSRPMMEYMEERYGFMSYFAGSEMDPLTRLEGPTGLNDQAFEYFKRRVRVAVDVQEGILTLYVQARSPEDVVRFGDGILTAAEAHINEYSYKISADQISSLSNDVQEAERQLAEASRSLATVQARRGELSPEQTATAIYQLISQLQLQLAETQRERNALLEQGLTESPLLPGLSARVEELQAQIAQQRSRLVNPSGNSLQRTVNEFERAATRKEIAEARWQSTMNVLQQAYLRILEERRYFVLVVGMASGAIPAVRDVYVIAVPILLFLALAFAIAYIVRRLRRDGRFTAPRFDRIVETWRRR